MPLGLAAAVGTPRAGSILPFKSDVCAPPRGFRAAEGVVSAWPCESPFGATPSRISGTAAQRNGLRYERKALKALSAILGPTFQKNAWFEFSDKSGRRYCQVDGLLRGAHSVAIIEVKYSFTSNAYYQLRKLYEPVVRKAFSPQKVALIVVCRNFDPSVPFPESYQHMNFGPGWFEQLSSIGVFTWRP